MAACHARAIHALDDVSFTVQPGEALAILGRNGSGKSTLLHMLCGTLQPDTGTVRVNGSIGALLELGTGFNPEFTGRENAMLTAALHGLDERRSRLALEEAMDFAELGEQIDDPVRTYSSGMFVRLAFSVQTAMRPAILIIDEALGVGDVFFQQKCARRLAEIRQRGTTLIFVSHDTGAVQSLCDRALLLDKGRLLFDGNSSDAVARYLVLHAQASSAQAKVAEVTTTSSTSYREGAFSTGGTNLVSLARERVGSRDLELLDVRMVDNTGMPTQTVEMCGLVRLHFRCRAHTTIQGPQVGIRLHDRFSNEIFSAGNMQLGYVIADLVAGDVIDVEIELSLTVQPGPYTLTLIASATGPHGPNSGMFYDVVTGVGPINVFFDGSGRAPCFNGMAQIPMRFISHLRHAAID
jgi:lipopolysaccharide transport system ATP-binding protein